jgi:hypothetical protein
MRRYDVCSVKSPRGGLIVVLQHDSFDHLNTCIVAPLIAPLATERDPKLRPLLEFDGKRLQLQIDRMAAVLRTSIGPTVGTFASERDTIRDAIDRLFIGF